MHLWTLRVRFHRRRAGEGGTNLALAAYRGEEQFDALFADAVGGSLGQGGVGDDGVELVQRGTTRTLRLSKRSRLNRVM